MAKIVVKKNGQTLNEVSLDPNKEYFGGRSLECEFHLDENHLSRKHFHLYFQDDKWNIKVLSQYAPLQVNTAPMDYSVLNHGDVVQVGSFVLNYEDAEAQRDDLQPTEALPLEDSAQDSIVATEDTQGGWEGTLNLDPHSTDPSDSLETPPNFKSADATPFEDDKTFVPEGSSKKWSVGVAYLIVMSPDAPPLTLRLEGDYWTLGRDENCDIFIDEPKASREHCEIYRKNQNYYILDPSSSNGTFLNNDKILYKTEYELISGDTIQIGRYTFTFEIRDPYFQEKMALIPTDISQAPLVGHHSPALLDDPQQRVVKVKPQKKKNPLFYGILGILTLVLIYGVLTEEEGAKKSEMASQSPGMSPISNNPLDALSDDQKDYVEKTYKLSQALYKEGKYELALVEVDKILTLIPEYKDIKDIQKYSRVAIDTLMEQQELRRQAEEQKRMAQKIQTQLNQCESSYKMRLNSAELETCLSPIEEIDPENPRISQLRALADQHESQKEAQQAQKEAYRARVSQRRSLYRKAENLQKSGKILDAIAAHGRNVASTLPDPENYTEKSKKEIEALETKIKRDLEQFSREAESAYQRKDYKAAVLKLEDAMKLNPQDREIQSQHEKYLQELWKIVKTLYGDSVLEENLGNIESAKEKWKKIRDLDVEYGDYFKKATTKLKKYGA